MVKKILEMYEKNSELDSATESRPRSKQGCGETLRRSKKILEMYEKNSELDRATEPRQGTKPRCVETQQRSNDSLWIDDDLVCNGFNQREEEDAEEFTIIKSANFNIYPNPGSGMFTLIWDKEGEYKINIIDMLGRNVYAKNLNSTESIDILNLSLLNNGIYRYTITEGTQLIHNSSISIIK